MKHRAASFKRIRPAKLTLATLLSHNWVGKMILLGMVVDIYHGFNASRAQRLDP